MLIIGAKGYAKEILQYFHDNNELENLFFYDDVSEDIPELLWDKFPILRNLDEAKKIFEKIDDKFVLGVGNPQVRYKLAMRMKSVGGKLSSVITKSVEIGSYGVLLGKGVTIMSGTIITNDISIGSGTLLNLNCTIGHDSIIGEYCELSPGVHISGHVKIDNYCSLGTGTSIIPGIHIGENAIIGAGSVVNRNIPANSVAVGVPAKVMKENKSFEL